MTSTKAVAEKVQSLESVRQQFPTIIRILEKNSATETMVVLVGLREAGFDLSSQLTRSQYSIV